MEALSPQNHTHGFRRTFRGVLIALVCAAGCISLFVSIHVLERPPKDFPIHAELTIPEGATTKDIITSLKNGKYVRSGAYLTVALKLFYDDAFIQAGVYSFDRPLDSREVLAALTSGEYLLPPITVTFYEGVRGVHIKEILARTLPDNTGKFSAADFDEHIGFLFPDTYHISGDITAQELIALMRTTFDEKTQYLSGQFEASPYSHSEIITLASIIEREANTKESMEIVSGILHERLRIGMPLQVDATFEYLLGKTSAELTENDLAFDSPYNTYLHTGLPPTPIANPGLQAIEAALNPKDTEFLYYLTGRDGEFYYARTFEEHKYNKERYLW